jgi:glycosyltransferase involved in cell wall biosynthesis
MGAEAFAREAAARGERVSGHEDVPQARLHHEVARRRTYLHTIRWTSLGLALLEAMHLGMPVVALSTTEVPEAVPAGAGVVSNRLDVLAAALRRFAADPDEAAACGRVARDAALARYGLARFLADWDDLLAAVVADRPAPARRRAGGPRPAPHDEVST